MQTIHHLGVTMIPLRAVSHWLWLSMSLLTAWTAIAQTGDTTETFASLLRVGVRPVGAPQYGDVCFSSRWRRPVSPEDPHDTFREAAAFHATRFDWVYTTDSSWIRECRQRGYLIGTALNSKLPDTPGVNVRHIGRIHNQQGSPVSAPWMEGWDAWWGCVNSPEYRAIVREHAHRCMDGGADYLHVDDPDMNYRAVEWGGCHCPYCLVQASAVGVDLTDPVAMRAFQKKSVARFYEDFRAEINAYAGRRVPLSCNNYRAVWDVFPYALFDFGMAELPEADARPDTIYHRLSVTRTLGKAQILTFVSEDTHLSRRIIATAYALGAHVLVPWDVYLKSTPQGSIRYFGRPEDFADLYGFVRASREHLDGYEEAAAAGFTAPNADMQSPVTIRSPRGGKLAVLRAKPADPGAPVVIHVIDWSGDGDSTVISIDSQHLPGKGSFGVTMLLPVAFAENTHADAERSRDYRHLAHAIKIPTRAVGDKIECTLPPLSPWGLLVVKASSVEQF